MHLVNLGIVLAGVGLIDSDSPPKPAVTIHKGRVVTVFEIKQGRDGRLVMSEQDRYRTIVRVPASASVLLNNRSATLSQLDRGDRVLVETDVNGKATDIVATRSSHPKNPKAVTSPSTLVSSFAVQEIFRRFRILWKMPSVSARTQFLRPRCDDDPAPRLRRGGEDAYNIHMYIIRQNRAKTPSLNDIFNAPRRIRFPRRPHR